MWISSDVLTPIVGRTKAVEAEPMMSSSAANAHADGVALPFLETVVRGTDDSFRQHLT